MKIVTLYTDGACSGNPGPGGWGAILEFQGIEKELSGGEENTTNNRMELTAVIKGLQALGYDGAITIEREISGEQQIADIMKAKALLENCINQ